MLSTAHFVSYLMYFKVGKCGAKDKLSSIFSNKSALQLLGSVDLWNVKMKSEVRLQNIIINLRGFIAKLTNIKLLVLVALFMLPYLSIANIQDQALLKCIDSTLKKQGFSNANELTKLKCHKKGIVSLSGIETLPNLKHLSLFANKLQSADVSQLGQLEYLNLSKNSLTSIKVASLEKLQTLFVFKNKLSEVDLSGLYSLKKLRISDNQLSQVNTQDLISLEEGHLWNNQLKEFDIKPLIKLIFLDVKQNPMPDELYDFYDQQIGVTISHDGNADDWK